MTVRFSRDKASHIFDHNGRVIIISPSLDHHNVIVFAQESRCFCRQALASAQAFDVHDYFGASSITKKRQEYQDQSEERKATQRVCFKMTTKVIAFCLFLFLGSALITLGVKQQHHFREWLPTGMSSGMRNGHDLVKPKVAFATFLSATTVSDDDVADDDDGYFLSTRVLAYQLLHSKTAGTNSSIPFLVVCTEDVSLRKRARLEKDGATVVVVEKLHSDWMKPFDARWADLLTKLRLFELTQYHKICYMDSDTMVTSSLDGVFYDEATLSQTTMDNPDEIKDDEGPLPRSYMLASHTDYWGYDHPFPPTVANDYLNCGFLVFSPSKPLFNYYMSLANIPDRFDSGFMEQNLLNYAHRNSGNMPWRPLWYGWNVNWPTEKDWRGGAKSFHAKYWDGDPSHDPVLKGIWKEQRAEMEGFHRGRELALQ